MITFILFILLGAGIPGVAFVRDVRGDYGGFGFAEALLAFFIFLIGGMLGGLLGFGLAAGIGEIAANTVDKGDPNICHVTGRDTLQNLGTETGIGGHFFLGSGYVRNELTYFYFTKRSDGGFASNQTPGYNGIVYEDQKADTAYVEYFVYFSNNWFVELFGMPTHSCTTGFHVPPGTVDHNFQAKP